MERKRTGRLLAAFVVALVATLGLVLGLGSTAYAKEYTTLSVGDVLHVGDTINSTTTYVPSSAETSLGAHDRPWTLVRCDVDTTNPGTEGVVESDSGPYYSFKDSSNSYSIYSTFSGVGGIVYAATATSDGIYVKEFGEAEDNDVQVTFAVHEPVAVTGVTLDPSAAQTITEGDKVALTATVSPDNATDKTVKWTVGGTDSSAVELYSDETCETPVETGKVTATLTVYAKGVSAGKATVTCTSYAEADKSASCDVTVKAATVPVASVELDQATATIEAGKTATLKATVKPDDATDKTVTWESSDEKVATVDKDGTVTAVAAGKATITAKAGDKTATCEVTVTQPVTGVELDKKDATLEVGKTVALKATVKPDDATDKTVAWESSDEKVATVKDGTVTAVAAGKATITARAGDKTATCEVTVTATPEPGPEPAGAEMFRLYNPYTGEHFYTASAEERDFNVGLGWQDEGVGWVAPEEGTPVFRVYNPYAGDHHYTTSEVERDHLVSVGWNDEGVGWNSAAEEGCVPLWRQYNPNAIAGAHNYTTSEAERDHLVEIGWSDEGIGWYGLE